MFTDHHNTSVKNVHAEKNVGGQTGAVSSDPRLNPDEKKQKQNDDKNSLKSPKLWLRNFRQLLEDQTLFPQGRAVLSSLLSRFLSVFPPSLRSLSRT